MKNCELNVRSIDEGAMDEKSGMNFSEYIAVLSGDTSLLEKSKLEKKIAVMESLRSVHFKELSRNRVSCDWKKSEVTTKSGTLGLLERDESLYKSQLSYDKEGIKVNPIQLDGVSSADAELIGNFILKMYKGWSPNNDVVLHKKIGTLYGFDLFIKYNRSREYRDGQYYPVIYNNYYVEHKEGGIKYTYGTGQISTDNPKLAARHFLNALDSVTRLREKYQVEVNALGKDIQILEKLIEKPFDKDEELKQLKLEHGRLEKEIAAKLQSQKQLSEEKSIESSEALVNKGKKKILCLTTMKVAC